LNEIQQIAGKVAKGAFGPHLNRVADLIPSASSTIADEEKSVTREIEHVRAYAERKGWTVAEEHVYADDGISGAEFLKRPDFLRLMNALKPRPCLQVLMMSEVSRLGREQIETAYAMKQITEAGVAVWSYLDDRRRVLDPAMDKVMLSLVNVADEVERERARARTYDAMRRKAPPPPTSNPSQSRGGTLPLQDAS
jgi:DNA invertase Pin-like site-specific DNA recombinase